MTSEANTLAELIDDCAEIPDSLRPASPALPLPRAAKPWQVNDVCTAQVADINDYGA